MRSPLPASARRGVAALLAVALYAASAWLLYELRPPWQDHELRSDENQYLVTSVHMVQQLLRGGPPPGLDPEQAAQPHHPWRVGIHTTNWGYDIPSLPKWVWGAVLHAAGHRDATLKVIWPYYDRREEVYAASRTLLPLMPWARWTVLALSAATAVLLFAIGRDLGGWVAGLGAWGLWIVSPLVYHRAMYIRIDFFQLLFSLAALWWAMRAWRALGGQRGLARMWGVAVGLGVLCGLAVSSKLSGFYNGVAIAAWVPLLWWTAPAPRPGFWRGPAAALALAGGASFAVFYTLNPVLWGDPLGGVVMILERWDQLLVELADSYAWEGGKADTLGERVAMATWWIFHQYEPVADWTGIPAGLALLPLGAAVLGVQAWGAAWRQPPGSSPQAARIVALYAAASFAVVTAWLPLKIHRYFLPYHPTVVLLEALLAAALLAFAAGRLEDRFGWPLRRWLSPPSPGSVIGE